MEQQMLKERAGRAKLGMLGKSRAMEHQMKAPQLMDDADLPGSPEMTGSGAGGGEAGMKRVIGSAKPRGRPKKITGGAVVVGGAMSLNDHLEGDGKCGSSNGVMTGGAKMGKELGEHIMKLHGEGFFSDFLGGLKSVLKPIAGVASFLPGPIGTVGRVASGLMGGAKKGKMYGGEGPISGRPSGVQVSHARMSRAEDGLPGQALGGQDVPPGGLAHVAYGNAPQAPASFKRNTVGEGKPMLGEKGKGTRKMAGEGFLSDLGIPVVSNIAGLFGLGAEKKARGRPKKGSALPAGAGLAGAGPVAGAGKRSARGQMISKLMKEKGMSLPEASRFLKENGGMA
jgi:hypothetical protein